MCKLCIFDWNIQCPKNCAIFYCPYLRQVVTDFQNSFVDAFCEQLAIKWLTFVQLSNIYWWLWQWRNVIVQTCALWLRRLATARNISLYGTMTRPLIDVLSSSTAAAEATKTVSVPGMRVRPAAASASRSFLVLVSARLINYNWLSNRSINYNCSLLRFCPFV